MFRGKENDGEQWVYGGFVSDGKKAFIISKQECKTCGDESYCKDPENDKFPCYKNNIEVEPESVAMQTGKQDKHKVDIYGSFEYEPGKMSSGGDELSNGSGRICEVKWHKWDCCWDAVPIFGNNGKGNVNNFMPRAWNHCEILQKGSE